MYCWTDRVIDYLCQCTVKLIVEIVTYSCVGKRRCDSRSLVEDVAFICHWDATLIWLESRLSWITGVALYASGASLVLNAFQTWALHGCMSSLNWTRDTRRASRSLKVYKKTRGFFNNRHLTIFFNLNSRLNFFRAFKLFIEPKKPRTFLPSSSKIFTMDMVQ